MILKNILLSIKRHALRSAFSLCVLLFFVAHASKIWEWSFIEELEMKAYDARLEITMPQGVDSRVVILDIDEKSLSDMGRWPWNRKIISQLFDNLFDKYHADVLGIDVVFAEADESSGLKKLEELGRNNLKHLPQFQETLNNLRNTLDYDARFADSMRKRRIVLGYTFTNALETLQDAEIGKLPTPVIPQEQLANVNLSRIEANGFVANLPLFQLSASSAGHFNSSTDSDGIVRRVPMLYGYKNQLYESLSLAVTRVALGMPQIEMNVQQTPDGYLSLESLIVQNRRIPVDRYIQALVPYRGKHHSFTYISASDVFQDKVANPDLLNNKIVLLGTTAQGLLDLRATPVESIYPGVEIHANLIAGILDNRIMDNPTYIQGMEVLLLLSIGLVMITFLPLFSPLTATLGTAAVLGGVVWLNLAIWVKLSLVLPLASTLLLILSLFLFNMSYGYFVESTGKRHLTKLFGQYIPPELVDEMSKNLGNDFSMEGESREMTVLFSDVRGFTTISEGLNPKELSALMNEFLTPMTRIIHEHRGTIDKYMGDAIMAFWGAPLHDAAHAEHALEAGLAMIARLHEMQPIFKEKGWPEIKIGVGLNTGSMSVGNMGSEFRMAYTVLGDAVNLGSRLEGITKQYGVQLIVSETTKEAAPHFVYRELDCVRVKGKDRPVAIFEPLGRELQVSLEDLNELAAYHNALEDYRRQQWRKAKTQFAQLQAQHPQRLLYKIYAERVEYFMENPPSLEWDGVYTFTTK